MTRDDAKCDSERERTWERRTQRLELRGNLWGVTGLERLSKCGRCSVSGDGQIGLRITESANTGRIAGFSGLATCGSVWACPSCAAKIAVGRAEELSHVLDWATTEGHTVAMLTVTMQHKNGDGLADLMTGLSKSWNAMTSTRAWKKTLEDWGILGWARAVEVTHGRHGWHPHAHIVVVLEGEQPPECVEKLGEHIWPQWYKALQRRGFTAQRGPGLDIRTSTDDTATGLASYFIKALAMEATGGALKQGRGKGRAPFQIAADFFATGNLDDLDLWHEYELATKGKRQLTWSKALRELAGLAADEPTDEELAEESIEDEDLMMIDAETFKHIAPVQAQLLIAAERGGLTAAHTWMTQHGYIWIEPDYRPDRT